MVYALRESLKLVCEEGLVETWARHRANAGMVGDNYPIRMPCDDACLEWNRPPSEPGSYGQLASHHGLLRTEMLWAGLEKMGIKMHVPIENRLPSLTTACIPEGIDGKAVCTYVLGSGRRHGPCTCICSCCFLHSVAACVEGVCCNTQPLHRYVLNKFNLELGGGLGELAGKGMCSHTEEL